jgi:hypothetical protein
MDSFWELLKILLPSTAVLLCAYFLVKKFLDSETKKRELEIRKNTSHQTIPIRLQAFERILIFLERIHPVQLAIRLNQAGISTEQLHREMLKSIKSEYEHNISQQLYVGSDTWDFIKTAKEETIKIINLSYQKVNPETRGSELAQVIIQLTGNVDKLPSQIAIEMVKKEALKIF